MEAIGRDGQAIRPILARCDKRRARDIALFGMRDGVAWVAEDAFVTREGEDILVEKWVGHRVVSILVRRPTGAGWMAGVWSRLRELAEEAQDFRTGTQLPGRAS